MAASRPRRWPGASKALHPGRRHLAPGPARPRDDRRLVLAGGRALYTLLTQFGIGKLRWPARAPCARASSLIWPSATARAPGVAFPHRGRPAAALCRGHGARAASATRPSGLPPALPQPGARVAARAALGGHPRGGHGGLPPRPPPPQCLPDRARGRAGLRRTNCSAWPTWRWARRPVAQAGGGPADETLLWQPLALRLAVIVATAASPATRKASSSRGRSAG